MLNDPSLRRDTYFEPRYGEDLDNFIFRLVNRQKEDSKVIIQGKYSGIIFTCDSFSSPTKEGTKQRFMDNGGVRLYGNGTKTPYNR